MTGLKGSNGFIKNLATTVKLKSYNATMIGWSTSNDGNSSGQSTAQSAQSSA